MDSATGEVIQTFENVSNFIKAAQRFTTEVFSARDLEDCGERPQVGGRMLGGAAGWGGAVVARPGRAGCCLGAAFRALPSPGRWNLSPTCPPARLCRRRWWTACSRCVIGRPQRNRRACLAAARG